MRRILRLLAAVPLMVVFVVAVVLLVVFATNPGPRESPGWTLLAPMPGARGETTTAVLQDRLYVIGGLTGVVASASDAVSIYDPASDAWTEVTSSGVEVPKPTTVRPTSSGETPRPRAALTAPRTSVSPPRVSSTRPAASSR